MIDCLLRSFPLDAAEHSAVGALFWATVCGSWGLTLVRIAGRRNYSIVDRLWPALPSVFVLQWMSLLAPQPPQQDHPNLVFVDLGSAAGQKAAAAQLLVFAWTLRLAFNSARRGDYAWEAEDYRWAYVRGWFGRRGAVAWEVFNFLFISVFQISLLYLLAKPVRNLTVYAAARSIQTQGPGLSDQGWSTAEIVLAAAMVLLLELEAVADKQQYMFQTGKRQSAAVQAPEHKAGFVHTGLWRFSRHPNVFCEQAFWLCIAVFSAKAASVSLCSWQSAFEFLAGPAALVALMWGSVELTESISRSKYPLYRAYQVKTSRLVPWVPWPNDRVTAEAHKRLAC
ncbi:hypothetical protein LPJ72_005253 [Coemansia sp. Benny D160-2]|nr:hypothetical protein LPJ72_005253 [Coemansia sp. Benny D160-2]